MNKAIAAALLLILGSNPYLQAGNITAKAVTEFRYDDPSSKAGREQYRLRFYPRVSLGASSQWSVHAFAATGSGFAASHNTLNDGRADRFYLRRLYLRHQRAGGKTEIGVIPTFKGRVSSTGLSKNGWISGVRQVFTGNSGRLELVAGDLNDLQANRIFDRSKALNFFELEYSSNFINRYSYELSAERLLGSNFLRAELRYRASHQTIYSLEIIHRLKESAPKIVIAADGHFRLRGSRIDYYGYYNYVDRGFGPRAELTEGFLGDGHGVSLKLGSQLSRQYSLGWFSRFDLLEGNSRFRLGIKHQLSL